MKPLPTALTHYDNWGSVPFAGPLRALVISDLHIPYHSTKAVELAIEYGKNNNANTVLINGDMADFFALSTWEKDPRKRNLANEVKAGQQFLEVLRDSFPKAKIILKEGNHEERWERYLETKAAELLDLPEFSWKRVYNLGKFKVAHVGDRRPIKLGKIIIIHGHEYRFNISNPVNPARGLFLRGKTHALCGHFHQSSQHSEKRLDDQVISTWSQGCLCDLHPDYAPINNWNHGFAFIEVSASGAFHVTNTRIIRGEVYS
jgi:predicted phosphodiesterase